MLTILLKVLHAWFQKRLTPDKNWSGLTPDPASSFAPYRVYNIGNNKPVELLRFIEIIEQKLGKKAIKNFLPIARW